MDESRWSGIEIYIPLFIIAVAVVYCVIAILLSHILFWIMKHFFNKDYSKKAKNRVPYIIVVTGAILYFMV